MSSNGHQLDTTFNFHAETGNIVIFEFLKGVDSVDQNVHQAELILSKMKRIFDDNPDRMFKFLVDLSPISQNTHYPSPKARAIFAEALGSSRLEKVAIVVPSLISRSITRFVLSLSSGRKRTKLFGGRDQALTWLRQK